jgi:gas vesicle protein
MTDFRPGDFVAGLLLGALIGAGLGLAFAPYSGEETRKRLAEKGEELKERAAEKTREAWDKGKEAVRQKGEEITSAVRARLKPGEGEAEA